MKISIRQNCFETNSSSNHSLILTTKQNCEKDKAEFKKSIEKEFYFMPGCFNEPVETKEEKCYFLGGLFDFDYSQFGILGQQYKIFIKVLTDNNENEILETLAQNRKEFLNGEIGDPCCSAFYDQGVLSECNCCFYEIFEKFFQVKNFEDPEKDLYNMIYDFIFGDGVIIPYEYL